MRRAQAACVQRDHPTRPRDLRKTERSLAGRRRKLAGAVRLDGTYLLSSSNPRPNVALGYKKPRQAERCFRDLLTALELRVLSSTGAGLQPASPTYLATRQRLLQLRGK